MQRGGCLSEFAELVLLPCLHLSLARRPVWLKYSEQAEAVGVVREPSSAPGTGAFVMGGPFCISAQQCWRRGLVPSPLISHCAAAERVGGGYWGFAGWVG